MPTFQEAGLKDFEAIGFLGVVAPAGVPPEELATLNRAFATVLKDPEVLARFKAFGSAPLMTSRKEFDDFIDSEIKKWTAVVEAANLRQEVVVPTDREVDHAQASTYCDCNQRPEGDGGVLQEGVRLRADRRDEPDRARWPPAIS